MDNMVGKKVVVDGEVMTIIRVSNLAPGYYARLERTGEELYIADFQIDKVLDEK